MKAMAALACGAIFGAGLTLAGMTNPERVLGFLDVLGAWDPTLALVMLSALTISLPIFQWAVRRSPRPVLDHRYHPPQRTDIDRDLLLGALVFGIGWGLVGLCPGPAIAGLASGALEYVVFGLAMMAGIALHAGFDVLAQGRGKLVCERPLRPYRK